MNKVFIKAMMHRPRLESKYLKTKTKKNFEVFIKSEINFAISFTKRQ